MPRRFESFVSAVRNRKPGALQDFVNQYHSLAQNTVRRYLARRLRKRVDSGDLLNDFWVSVLRRVDRLPHLQDSQDLRAYLRRIAFRQVTKQQRRHLKVQRRRLDREVDLSNLDHLLPPGDRTPSPSANCERSNEFESLKGRLSDREWKVLTLRLDGNSNRQIAESLAVDEGTVRRIVRRIGRKSVEAGLFRDE